MPDTSQLDRWRKSAEFRAIASRTAKANLVKLRARPRCGAKNRVNGEPCRNVALANGRCHLHGGKTPKGKDWHKTQWPKKDRPDVMDKLVRKVADQERAYKRRQRRLAGMNPDERACHEEWERSHRPGGPAGRAVAREARDQAGFAKSLLADSSPIPISSEAKALETRLAELRKRKTELEQAASFPHIGVFE